MGSRALNSNAQRSAPLDQLSTSCIHAFTGLCVRRAKRALAGSAARKVLRLDPPRSSFAFVPRYTGVPFAENRGSSRKELKVNRTKWSKSEVGLKRPLPDDPERARSGYNAAKGS